MADLKCYCFFFLLKCKTHEKIPKRKAILKIIVTGRNRKFLMYPYFKMALFFGICFFLCFLGNDHNTADVLALNEAI